MKNKTIADIHNHIYPDLIAAKAVENVGHFYHLTMNCKGTTGDLLRLQQEAGISYSLIHSVALKADNVTSINDFIAEQATKHPSLIGFATMHHDFADKEREINRAIALGLKGFKIHTDSQGVNIDDERLMEFYGMLEGRLPLMVHCGDYRWDNSHPRRVKEVLRAFPNLVVNAAHFGGWSLYDLAVEYLLDENCFMDLSSAAIYLGPRRTTELIRIYGADRILFGSDYPMWNPVEEVQRFLLNDLTELECEKILHRNAEAYLGLELSQ
ncbi:MAG: amidohydrolase family protein [Coriobacteriia bacterium]|nr:amidohydrolase family protein [Coriobacteriia bacterium]